MKHQQFEISIPEGLHDSLLEALEKYEHVERHNDHGLVVTPPDGNGLVFAVEPILGRNEAKVTVIENPNGDHIVHIRAQLVNDIAEFKKTGKVARYEAAEKESQKEPPVVPISTPEPSNDEVPLQPAGELE